MTLRVAIYCRISSAPTGKQLGVGRQREDCTALAEQRGWEVAAVFTDNDVSAYSGKPRPSYREMIQAAEAGRIDVVLAWHPDRLHRSPVELEEFISLVERHGVQVETVQAGRWDLSSSSGRLIARSLGNLARYESDHKSERVRRALAQNAASGRRHGRVPYGWRHEFDPETGVRRDVVDVDEAHVVRQIAKDIIAGTSIREITAKLNADGTPSPRGGPWHKNMVRALVLRERNAGLRIHRGGVVGDGDWPAILERAEWEQVRAVLCDPARRTSTGTAAVHLLSGIASCGVCRAPIRAGKVGGALAYRCSDKSCVSRAKGPVDALVTAVIVGRLAQLDATLLIGPERRPEVRAALAEASELRARLDVAADDYADGKIDARQLERITSKLRPKITAAEARGRVVDDGAVLDGLAGLTLEQVEERWTSLPLSRQRAVVDLLLAVRILPTTRRDRTFDPEAIELRWKCS